MSDERLLFKKTPRGLAPADERAQAWLSKIKLGTDVLIDPPRQPRNLKHHRLYWSLVHLVHQNLDEERAARCPTPETLHQALKVCAGLRTEVVLKNGERFYMPGSIAFHKLDQAGFAQFYDRVCDIVCRDFLPGLDDEMLRYEVAQMVGAEYA